MDQPKTIHVVTRPSITVVERRTKEGVEPMEIRYDAANLNIVTRDGRYCLSFICSGQIMTIPAAGVKALEFNANGAQWCISCESQLTSWPVNDPGYHREFPVDATFGADDAQAMVR